MTSSLHNMYYIAIICPAAIDEKILQFKHWMRDRFDCKVALKSPAHITIIPPFWCDSMKETDLIESLEKFSYGIKKIETHLKGFSHFGKKVLFVWVEENLLLEDLKKYAEDYFIKLSGDVIKRDDRPFRPHITIANRDLKPTDFEKAWEHFSKKEYSASFRANTLSLLKLDNSRWIAIANKVW